MVRLNSIPLTECTRKLHEKVGELDRLIRDGKVSDLCEAFGTIECEAREAGYIINDMVRR